MAADETAPVPRVFTIAPGRPFLDALAAAILAGDLPAPGGPAPGTLELTDVTILLPTRRAARALGEAFLARAAKKAMLLPRIRAIGIEDEGSSLAGDVIARPAADAELLPPAIGTVERLVALCRLVLAWSRSEAAARGETAEIAPFRSSGAATPAQAMRLSIELARLMDTVETEAVTLVGLKDLVASADLAEHWRQTVDFLAILTEHWPATLAARGLLSPMDRRNRLLMAEAARLAANLAANLAGRPPMGPVIVAGVTGSIPAAAALIGAVARLPQGAVVLPALDLALDATIAARIAADHAEHPQYGLLRLLDRLGVPPSRVAELPGRGVPNAIGARQALVSEAMLPPSATVRWPEFAARAGEAALDAALAGLTLIEAAGADEEAEAAALILREALETPGRTAALVSPDRILARRVAVRLEAFGLRVDDSAGRPLAKTMPGAFLDLLIEAVVQELAPVAAMALLKHPLVRLGLEIGPVRRAARALEIAVFRQPYLGAGSAGIVAALERAAGDRMEKRRRGRAFDRMWDEDIAAARDLVARLAAALAPLEVLFAARDAVPLADLVRAHAAAAEALAAVPAEARGGAEAGSILWDGEGGAAAAGVIARLLDPALPTLALAPRDYPDLWRTFVMSEAVRPSVPAHPRISIWGPIEARLMQPDVVILGGLNEGTWPEASDPGPWLNRAMRGALGLPSPDEAIGRSAHDVTTLLGADRVYLTRAQKVDGAPTVPSRWLMRLEALLSGSGRAGALTHGAGPWLALARRRDEVERRRPAARPMPRPPVALRPRRLSVSDVERWIANPYAIFAGRILGLEALDPLGPAPDQRLRGQIVHAALGHFATRHPASLPADTRGSLVAIAQGIVEDLSGHPRIMAFWLPRLARFAAWFAQTEAARRDGYSRVHAEVAGTLVIEAPAGPFRLTARADRIDASPGGLFISDYKTGRLAKEKDVRAGKAPQLVLEAAIAAAGGFAGIDARQVRGLRYIRAAGGIPAGEEVTIAPADLDAVVDAARAGLARLIARFDDPATPYAAIRRAGFDYSYDTYAHLARLAEWAGDDDGEE